MKNSRYLAGAMTIGLILPAVVLGTSLPVVGHQRQSIGSTGRRSVAFVRDASHAGQFEVQSGRLALERSQHGGVRGFATQSVRDADEMLNRVKFINGANVGVSMPYGLTNDQQALLKRLAGLSGSDFDREYMRSQIEVGELLKKAFSDYGSNGESPTMRIYAAKAADDYDAQLMQARTIAGSL
jgi:putative membrane protein